MARKAVTRKAVEVEEETSESRSSLFDYLRFGESYTSLILGIIVVIISTVLLLSFVHNRNTDKQDIPQLLSQKDIALPSNFSLTGKPSNTTVTPAPTTKKTAEVAKGKPGPTAPVKATPTPVKVAQNTNTNTKPAQGNTSPSKGEYVVAAGDNLWTIAEKNYNSGYNWVDIARANNLSNPGVITAGTKLKLPKVEQKIATVQKGTGTTVSPPAAKNAISGATYKTVKGDTLWDISVRAYGDGFQWKKIASANNLSNPSLIHSGNTLKIPRG